MVELANKYFGVLQRLFLAILNQVEALPFGLLGINVDSLQILTV